MKKILLLLSLFIVISVVFGLLTINLISKNKYEVIEAGVLISDGEIYQLNTGDILKKRTNNNISLNGVQINNHGYIINDSGGIFTVGDTTTIDYQGDINYIPSYTEINKYINDYNLNDEEIILKSGNNYMVFSETIEYQKNKVNNYQYFYKDNSGYLNYSHDQEIEKIIPKNKEFIYTSKGKVDINSLEYTTDYLDNYKLNKLPSVSDVIDSNINLANNSENQVEEDIDKEETIDDNDTLNNKDTNNKDTNNNVNNNDINNINNNIVNEDTIYDEYIYNTNLENDSFVISGVQGAINKYLEFKNGFYEPDILVSIDPKWDYAYFSFSINDPEHRIQSANLNIIQYSDDKEVYNKDIDPQLDSKIDVQGLEPDTKYKYSLKISYIDSTGAFIEKTADQGVFFTNKIAIDLKVLDISQENITIQISTFDDIKFNNLTINLTDDNGNTQINEINTTDLNNQAITVEFNNLLSNTDYTLSYSDVIIDGKEYKIDDEIYLKTLKKTPVIGSPTAEIDYIKQTINVKNSTVEDSDELLNKLTFEVYNNYDLSKPIYSVTNSYEEYYMEVAFLIDGKDLQRNKKYVFKIIGSGYDNQKKIEVESDFSEEYEMDGLSPPQISLFDYELDSNSVSGKIEIKDINNSIVTGTPIKLQLRRNKVNEQEIRLKNNNTTEFNFENLEPASNYELIVNATFNLNNDNGIYKDYPIYTKTFSTPVSN